MDDKNILKRNIRSFFKGMLTLFNLERGHTFVSYSDKSPFQRDVEALSNDWKTVGDDIRNAIHIFSESELISENKKNSE